jgi:FK506-binding nuclear protein
MAKAKGAKTPASTPPAPPQEIAAEPGFFGCVINPGETLVWGNEVEELALQLTSAALGAKVTPGRSTLAVTVDESDVALCTLIPEKIEQCNLTHVFTPMDGPVKFRNEGVNAIHLTGMIDVEDDAEEGHHHDHDHDHDHGHGIEGMEGEMSGMYSDSDDDSDDSDNGVMIFGGDNDSDDSDDSDDSEELDEDDNEGRFEVIDERMHGDAGEKEVAIKKEETDTKKATKEAVTPTKKEKATKESTSTTPTKKAAGAQPEAKKDTTPAAGKKRAASDETADAAKKAKTNKRVYKGVTIEDM